MKPRAWNSTLPAPSKPMKRSALRSGSHPQRSELRSQSQLRRTPIKAGNPKRRAQLYAKQFGAGGDRRALVPLCRADHRALHDMGRRTFEARRGVDLAQVAAELWERYGGEG